MVNAGVKASARGIAEIGVAEGEVLNRWDR